jgi:hypothetical protein
MRSLLAVCLSAIMMMGAAEAATIDGNFNVVAGVPETYTFTVPLLPGEEFDSAKLSVNGGPWSVPASSATQTGSVSLKFLHTFEALGKQSLTVSAYINYVAFGSYECLGNTAGCYVPNALQNPLQKRISEFFVIETASVFVASSQKNLTSESEPSLNRAAVVPIAGSLPLLLSGLGILGWAARRRARVLA